MESVSSVECVSETTSTGSGNGKNAMGFILDNMDEKSLALVQLKLSIISPVIY